MRWTMSKISPSSSRIIVSYTTDGKYCAGKWEMESKMNSTLDSPPTRIGEGLIADLLHARFSMDAGEVVQDG